jgi:hypothetical protein
VRERDAPLIDSAQRRARRFARCRCRWRNHEPVICSCNMTCAKVQWRCAETCSIPTRQCEQDMMLSYSEPTPFHRALAMTRSACSTDAHAAVRRLI